MPRKTFSPMYSDLARASKMMDLATVLMRRTKARLSADDIELITKFVWSEDESGIVYLVDLNPSLRVTDKKEVFAKNNILFHGETTVGITQQVGKVILGDVRFGIRTQVSGQILDPIGANGVEFDTTVSHATIVESFQGAPGKGYKDYFLNIYLANATPDLTPKMHQFIELFGL